MKNDGGGSKVNEFGQKKTVLLVFPGLVIVEFHHSMYNQGGM